MKLRMRRTSQRRGRASASGSTRSAALDRDADVRGVERRRVVDSIAQEPDRVPGLLEREDDSLLLIRLHFREDVDRGRALAQGGVGELAQLAAAQEPRFVDSDGDGD